MPTLSAQGKMLRKMNIHHCIDLDPGLFIFFFFWETHLRRNIMKVRITRQKATFEVTRDVPPLLPPPSLPAPTAAPSHSIPLLPCSDSDSNTEFHPFSTTYVAKCATMCTGNKTNCRKCLLKVKAQLHPEAVESNIAGQDLTSF